VAQHSGVLRSALAWDWPGGVSCPNDRFIRQMRRLADACDWASDARIRDHKFRGYVTHLSTCAHAAYTARYACERSGHEAVREARRAVGLLRSSRDALGPLWAMLLLHVDVGGVL